MMQDTVGAEFDDPNFCKKSLRVYDQEGELLQLDYSEDTLYLEHEGHFTYNFYLFIRPDLVSSNYTLIVELCEENPAYCYDETVNVTLPADPVDIFEFIPETKNSTSNETIIIP